MSSNVCKFCGAAISWVTMDSGKSIPVDPERVEGLVVRSGQRVWSAAHHGNVASFKSVGTAFICHWARCPELAHFRERVKGARQCKGE